MARQGGRSRRGSLQFWPRKRAKRIYPRVNWSSVSTSHDAGPEPGLLGFAAWKAGTTHVSYINPNKEAPSSGKTITRMATILDSPPIFCAGVRYYKRTYDGMKCIGEEWHPSISKELQLDRITKINKKKAEINNNDLADVRMLVLTQPKKSGMHKSKPDILEIGISGNAAAKKEYALSLLGKEVSASDVFASHDFADVSAVTKGHGYTGPVKRFGIRIQTRKDKQMHRHTGSIGSTVPRKIDWRVPLPGQHGFFTRTEYNKKILLIDSKGEKINQKGGNLGYGLVDNFVLLEGSVPGPQKRLIILRKPLRKHAKAVVTLDYISRESKQGAR